MKLTGVELRRIAHAAGGAVPDVVRHRDQRATSCCCGRSPPTPRAGASASRWPTRSTPPSTSTAPPTCCAASSSRRWPRPAPLDAHAVAGRAARRSRATGWPRPRWRWRCSTPSCAPAGRSFGALPRRGPRPRAVRGLGRDHGLDPRAARRGRRLPRRGLPPDQAEDRAGLGRRAGARRARAVRRRVLLQVDANTAYTLADARHLARLDAFDLLLIEQPLDEDDMLGHAELAQARSARRSASTSRSTSARDRRRRDPARRLPDRQHQAGPGRRLPRGAPDPRRLRRRTACRSGAAACSRPGSAGRPTSRSPRCPASRCPATPRRPTATSRTDITEPFVLDDGHLAVPTGPGSASTPLPDLLAEVTTSTEWLPL